MKNDDGSNFQITELFMAKAGFGTKGYDRCFYGTIKEIMNENGESAVYGKIYVKNSIHDGFIYAGATDRNELSNKLNSMVIMILDKELHSNEGKFVHIKDLKIFEN